MEWKSGLDKIKIEIHNNLVRRFTFTEEGRHMIEQPCQADGVAFITHQGNRYAGNAMYGYLFGAPDPSHLPDEEYLSIPEIMDAEGHTSSILIMKESTLDDFGAAMRHRKACPKSTVTLCFATWIGVEPSVFDTLVSISKGEK